MWIFSTKFYKRRGFKWASAALSVLVCWWAFLGWLVWDFTAPQHLPPEASNRNRQCCVPASPSLCITLCTEPCVSSLKGCLGHLLSWGSSVREHTDLGYLSPASCHLILSQDSRVSSRSKSLSGRTSLVLVTLTIEFNNLLWSFITVILYQKLPIGSYGCFSVKMDHFCPNLCMSFQFVFSVSVWRRGLWKIFHRLREFVVCFPETSGVLCPASADEAKGVPSMYW